MEEKRKKVYVPMAVDILHPGHLNIIFVAESLGEVIVGLFSDEAIASYKRVPYMNYEQRKHIIENIKGVSQVVMQDTPDFEPNLRKYKPEYMVHGTDWKEGPLAKVREKAISVMQEWGGEVVEPEYTKNISSTQAHEKMKHDGTTSQVRQSKLQKSLYLKSNLHMIGIDNELGSFLAEDIVVKESGKPSSQFDAIWFSNQQNITGKSGFEAMEYSECIRMLNLFFDYTTKPIVFDCTASMGVHDQNRIVRTIERLGISGIAIHDTDKDKIYKMIKNAAKTKTSNYFMTIVYLENLLDEPTIDSAIIRLNEYIEAGADAFVFKWFKAGEVRFTEICMEYAKCDKKVPLMISVDNSDAFPDSKMKKLGIKAVLFENNFRNVALQAMKSEAERILLEANT